MAWLVACVLGTASLLCQVRTFVACVLGVAFILGVALDVYNPNWLEFVQGKMTPMHGVQGDAYVVACALVEASLPYP
jgi:hypothetical protein